MHLEATGPAEHLPRSQSAEHRPPKLFMWMYVGRTSGGDLRPPEPGAVSWDLRMETQDAKSL